MVIEKGEVGATKGIISKSDIEINSTKIKGLPRDYRKG